VGSPLSFGEKMRKMSRFVTPVNAAGSIYHVWKQQVVAFCDPRQGGGAMHLSVAKSGAV